MRICDGAERFMTKIGRALYLRSPVFHESNSLLSRDIQRKNIRVNTRFRARDREIILALLLPTRVNCSIASFRKRVHSARMCARANA